MVSDQGGFSSSIPLDLPRSRGGLPIPLQIVSGSKGFGAAGLGWDIPLSYVFVDQSFARRRPQYQPGQEPLARERITVALPGRTTEMVPLSSGMWIGRLAPDLLMTPDGDMWKVFDSNGFVYRFVQPTLLNNSGGPFLGGGLWLLDKINGAGGAEVSLVHDVRLATVPNSIAPAITVDLSTIEYNPGEVSGCYKNEIVLNYSDPSGAPQGLAILGGIAVARQSQLTTLSARIGHCYDGGTIRRYTFAYEPDADTLLPRLVAVDVHGRTGTPEAADSIPIARYSYGAATVANGGARMLHYEASSQSPTKPANAGLYLANSLAVDHSLFDAPGIAHNYASTQNLIDFTGDGRPDLVFGGTNGALQIAVNVPDAPGSFLFETASAFGDSTYTSKVLDARGSTVAGTLNPPGPDDRTLDFTWRQVIDINGDGRLDLIDASESADTWTIYVNTPDSGPSGIKWLKRAFDITNLRSQLASRGIAVATGPLPLSRRTTGRNYLAWVCWGFENGERVQRPHSYINDGVHLWCNTPDGSSADAKFPTGDEKSFVEWQLTDINGDGFPDVVFNSAPVAFAPYDPPPTYNGPNDIVVHREMQLVLPATTEVLATFNVAGLRMEYPSSPLDPFSEPITLLSPTSCGVGLWSGTPTGRAP